MFYVYILRSITSDRYYVGHTSDLDDRLKRHNQGRSKATKAGRPWNLAYSESFQSKSQASRREIQIKSWKSRRMIERLIN